MRDNRFIAAIAGVVALGSGVAIFSGLSGGCGPSVDPAPHKAVGRVLAQQARALLKPSGHLIVLLRDTIAFPNPATDIQFASFRKELSRAGIKIDSVRALQVDPLRPVAVPSGDFLQLLKTETKGSVIVSFMGPPLLTESQVNQLGAAKPYVVAFCSGPVPEQVDLRALFNQGLLHAAVVSKPQVGLASPASEAEIFDRRFVAVTSANIAALGSVAHFSP